MDAETRRSRKAWTQLVLAVAVAAVAVLSPLFSFSGLDEHTTVSDPAAVAPVAPVTGGSAGTGSTSGENGDRMGRVTASTVAVRGQYSLRTVKLNSGNTVTARWNPCQSAITYRVNLSGLPASKRAGMLATVRASFTRLHAATGMTYRYAGTTTFVPKTGNLTDQPAEIVVAAVPRSRTDFPMTSSSLGYGGVLWSTWYGSAGEGAAVVRGYVILDPNAMAHLRTGFGGGERQSNVILHELGHATGLDHVDNRSQQMDPTLTAASPSGYARGDLAGLAALGVKAGCIAIPTFVTIKDLR